MYRILKKKKKKKFGFVIFSLFCIRFVKIVRNTRRIMGTFTIGEEFDVLVKGIDINYYIIYRAIGTRLLQLPWYNSKNVVSMKKLNFNILSVQLTFTKLVRVQYDNY